MGPFLFAPPSVPSPAMTCGRPVGTASVHALHDLLRTGTPMDRPALVDAWRTGAFVSLPPDVRDDVAAEVLGGPEGHALDALVAAMTSARTPFPATCPADPAGLPRTVCNPSRALRRRAPDRVAAALAAWTVGATECVSGLPFREACAAAVPGRDAALVERDLVLECVGVLPPVASVRLGLPVDVLPLGDFPIANHHPVR